jgi:hypothetical protein
LPGCLPESLRKYRIIAKAGGSEWPLKLRILVSEERRYREHVFAFGNSRNWSPAACEFPASSILKDEVISRSESRIVRRCACLTQ